MTLLGVLVVRPFALPLFVAFVALMSFPAAVADTALVPPSPPMDVQASASDDGITITWDVPLFFGGASEVTYRVYRDSTLVADDLATTTYTDSLSSAQDAATAYYVTAVNDAGESVRSGGACVDLGGPSVDPGACVELAVDVALWVIGNLPL